MKINKVPLRAQFWNALETDCPFKVLKDVFEQIEINDLTIMLCYYIHFDITKAKSVVKRPENSMYNTAAINSLVLASYMIYLNKEIYYNTKMVGFENYNLNPLELNSLSNSECINPYLAIDDIFLNITVEKLETHLFDMLSVSLEDLENTQLEIYDYILFSKIIEACWLINERLKEKE